MRRLCPLLLSLAALTPLHAALLPQLDLAQCQVTPAGTVTQAGDALTIAVRLGPGPMGEATLRFREPLATTGKERLVLSAYGEEATDTYLCISRTMLLGAGEA
ncbi:MAG: hypothetical protein KKI08_21235, partial [Armatimonadetes bacterium]|nr:hypothetical protein [Armatimonadota bacterium]